MRTDTDTDVESTQFRQKKGQKVYFVHFIGAQGRL